MATKKQQNKEKEEITPEQKTETVPDVSVSAPEAVQNAGEAKEEKQIPPEKAAPSSPTLPHEEPDASLEKQQEKLNTLLAEYDDEEEEDEEPEYKNYKYSGTTIDYFRYKGTGYTLHPGSIVQNLPTAAPQVKRHLKNNTLREA